jgi:hypothetical protein
MAWITRLMSSASSIQMISSRFSGVVGSDGKDLGWVCVGLEVNDGERVVEGVEDCGIRDSVLAGRPMDLRIRNIVIQ